MKLKSAVIYSIILLHLLSCKKKEEVLPTANHSEKYIYKVYADNYPPFMGGCLDLDGKLVTYHVALFDGPYKGASALISSKILKFDAANSATVVADLGNTMFYAGGSSGDTVNGQGGWITSWQRISMAFGANNDLYFAVNRNEGISKVQNGQFIHKYDVPNINTICSSRGTIYAVTTVNYDLSLTTITVPSKIIRIDPNGTINTHFVFPTTCNMNYLGGATPYGQDYQPFDVVNDIVSGPDGSLYITSAYDNKIYKLDENNTLTTVVSDVFCPTSVAFDNLNRMYIVSGPEYKFINNTYEMIKPVEIVLYHSPANHKVIYTGELPSYQLSSLHNPANDNRYFQGDVTYNINITDDNKIYFEDTKKGRIILLEEAVITN